MPCVLFDTNTPTPQEQTEAKSKEEQGRQEGRPKRPKSSQGKETGVREKGREGGAKRNSKTAAKRSPGECNQINKSIISSIIIIHNP